MSVKRALIAGVLGALVGCEDNASPPQPADTLGQYCATQEDCADAFACNGDERCEGGRCVAGSAPDCDDGDRCTLDGCSEGPGCVHAASAAHECSGPDDAEVHEADASSQGDTGAPPWLLPPADDARPPDVECPTSVAALRVYKDEDLEFYRG